MFEQDLEELGFRVTGAGRRGRSWSVPYNRHLTFAVHEHDAERVLVSWTVAFGALVAERGWQTSLTDESAVELYPAADVLVARDVDAVRGELARVLATLQLDLGDPSW